jgi:transposase InsO family protein
MKQVYEVAGLTRQALHKYLLQSRKKVNETSELFEQADKIRREHPGSGCRKLALQLKCRGWGRDRLEQLLLNNGYRISHPPNYIRTTDHRKDFYYPNLIEGMEVDNICQVVQTDITYYRVGDKFYYIAFLIDIYSKRIVGYELSKSLHAEGCIRALKKMIGLRTSGQLKRLIHHSDRGSQYVGKQYRDLLQKHNITPSMCLMSWENAYVERINRTIKSEYLDHWKISNYASLAKRLRQAVDHYNHKRPHDSLNKQSPIAFETNVQNIPKEKRPKFRVYKYLEDNPQKRCG